MVEISFAMLTIAAGIAATFMTHPRRSILALWGAGLGVGAIYLTIGAEFLAIIQWIVSTLVTLSFIFFAVLFGEFHQSRDRMRKRIRWLIFSVPLGAVFTFIILKGAGHGTFFSEGLDWLSSAELKRLEGVGVGGLQAVGKKLTQDHFLSLEVLVLTLFLVLVGGSIVPRAKSRNRKENKT